VAISQGAVPYARCVTAGPYAAVVIPDASLPENTVGFSALTLRFPVWQRARARACAFFAAVRPTSDVLVREGNGMSGPGKPIMYYRILRASPRSHARYRTIESNRDAVVECLQSRALRREKSIVSI